MDKATNYLLIQESTLSNLQSSMKVIIPNVQSALLKTNVKAMKKIADRLPQKNIKDIERDAIRQIPEFKNDLFEAKTKLKRTRMFDGYTAKPAAIAVALVSSTTKKSVEDVIQKGEMSLRSAKILPVPGYFTLIKLGLFTSFIASIYLTDGAVILPTIKLMLRSSVLLFGLMSSVLKGIIKGMGEQPGVGDLAKKAFDKVTGATPDVEVPLNANDMSSMEQFLYGIDPLAIN